ncbi:MAG: lamin tail domain-containing protein, partial [Verrucomicrobia bacterium]|nr:lamin tail domain-containing protein [Verrucomicrobiota bacterium]
MLDELSPAATLLEIRPMRPARHSFFKRAVFFTASLLLSFVARADQVAISEIMYHAPRDLPAWVEVWNQTATPFDIAKWRLTGSIDFEFPDFTATNAMASFLRPFERIVISSATPEQTRAAYTNLPPNARVFGPWVGRIIPAGDRVTLKDKNGVTVCTVRWSDHGHWPAAANGAGHSLVLRDSNRKIDDWRNWTASTRPLGTPGFA